MDERRNLSLPELLCATAEKKFVPPFKNLEALLEYVLKDLTDNRAASMDKTEQSVLEERLRNLGYL